MINLTYNRNKKLNINKFKRIGDISNFEGPLLTLYEDLDNECLYLFDYVDKIDNYNRWIIYRVSANNLLQFLNKDLSHLDLFNNRLELEIYFTDIKYNISDNIFLLDYLPQEYYPRNDNYFDIYDCVNYNEIIYTINKYNK
jgi:hypothetical protein